MSDDEIKVGSRVRCGVFVLGKWVPMHNGIVMRDYGDGSYDVDRGSLHGARAWVERERYVRPDTDGVEGGHGESKPAQDTDEGDAP